MKKWLPILCMMMGMVACQQNIVSDDPMLQLDFSHDTVLFDTVFTSMGSSTKRVMVYNPNKQGAQKGLSSLIHDNRVNHVCPADYSEGGEMDRLVKTIIDKMELDDRLEQMEVGK